MQQRIAIGSDHAGFELKGVLMGFLRAKGFEPVDYGCHSKEPADYPEYAHKVAEAVESGHAVFGVLICGSGNGVNMTANRHKGIRSALAWTPEIAVLARQHNNANVIALPARFIEAELAEDILLAFLSTEFEGGRHQRRVDGIEVRC